MRYEKTKAYFEMRLAEKTHPPTTAQQKAFTGALEALEKQIPKKPLFATVNRDTACHCSMCNTFVCFCDVEKVNYCPKCGQAIDWSE